MKKVFLFLFAIINIAFSSEIEKLTNINQIKDNKSALIMFSTDYCVWCVKQKVQLKIVKNKYEKGIQIFEIKNSDLFYKQLLKEYPFTIKFYPTTFIIEKETNDLFIKYEFQGYQNNQKILNVLKDEDSF